MNKGTKRLRHRIAAYMGTAEPENEAQPVSLCKGVTYSPVKQMWRAAIIRNGRPLVIGYYATEERAAEAVGGRG